MTSTTNRSAWKALARLAERLEYTLDRSVFEQDEIDREMGPQIDLIVSLTDQLEAIGERQPVIGDAAWNKEHALTVKELV